VDSKGTRTWTVLIGAGVLYIDIHGPLAPIG
jgi:hypothetical protein